MASRIEDYAIVGDMQSAALVSADGSVDWLCLPRFDSEACFAALLGRPDHGCWRIAPEDELAGRRGATARWSETCRRRSVMSRSCRRPSTSRATPRSIGADRGMSAGACRAKRFGFP